MIRQPLLAVLSPANCEDSPDAPITIVDANLIQTSQGQGWFACGLVNRRQECQQDGGNPFGSCSKGLGVIEPQ
jgi:hypothetical protein